MRLQFKSPKDEPSLKTHIVICPLLLLLLIPFILAFILPFLFSPIQNYSLFTPEFYGQFENKSLAEILRLLILPFFIGSIPIIFFFMFYVFFGYGVFGVFGVIGDMKFFDSKYSRIQINLYEVLSRILFAEIIVLAALAIISYLFLGQALNSTFPLPLVAIAAFIRTMLGSSILLSYLLHLWPYFEKDFRYIMAKKCMGLANKEVNELEKINYLIAGLSWYSKYLERNFDLEFDTKRVASNIISSSSDKDQIVETIEKSFNEISLDKLKPVSCLSTFANLEPKEQFLIEKKMSTKIKEVGTFLAVIIPVIITIVQLAFTQFFPKP